MREKIAMAIAADVESGFPARVQMVWQDLSGPAKAAMFARADAVLAVLENPSLAMIEAGNRAMNHMPIETESDRHIALRAGFIAAIRAARKDQG